MFEDRQAAGTALAEDVAQLTLDDPVVLALPRGGVPVAVPVARRLAAPLDVLIVRKIGLPGMPELAAGALVEGGAPIFNADVLRRAGVRQDDLDAAVARERAAIADRRASLNPRPPVPLKGRDAVVVDDGIATGATMRAALSGLRARNPARVILAVPVAAPETVARLREEADAVVCLHMPAGFRAVGQYYDRFDQVADSEAAALLHAVMSSSPAPGKHQSSKGDGA